MKAEKLAEGKTKIIWKAMRRPDEAIIESKDDLTAGDGARHVFLPGKGALANTTTCNVFELLKRELFGRVPLAFLEQVSDTEFRARYAKMIPIEIVVRSIATGSFVHRHPEVREGTELPHQPVEFFLKDDAAHDPILAYDALSDSFLAYDAHEPVFSSLPLRVFSPRELDLWGNEDIPRMIEIAGLVFEVLHEAWKRQNVKLVDLKIECGIHESELVLADVIDNDSWRIWPSGDPTLRKDKDAFRKLPELTDEGLARVMEAYSWVAEATFRF